MMASRSRLLVAAALLGAAAAQAQSIVALDAGRAVHVAPDTADDRP